MVTILQEVKIFLPLEMGNPSKPSCVLKNTKEKERKQLNKIKKKVKAIHKAKEEAFEGPNDPDAFNQNSDRKLKDVFRDTRYGQRRVERLLKWRDKKYDKYSHQVKSYDNTNRKLYYYENE